MARFSIGLLFILACATYSLVVDAALLLDDKWQELETKLDTKVFQLEEKVAQLETQLEHNNELREELTLKVAQLEAKNVQLESKVQEQENILTFLLQATELPVSATGSKLSLSNREFVIQSTDKMSGIPRTCRELRATDPSLSSGMHWIDPDGQGVGDDPIYVYCNMSSGSTSILHDSELPIDVGHCADPGCYSRSVNYNAPIRQIKALAELSTECHQSIKYDCYYAPFELNNVAFAWWNDREGSARYFWAGNNTDGIHTCQCGINGNCVDNSIKCNCDIVAPIQLSDEGVITDKNVLPVTRLNFGRTLLETSSGIHTLGRFECTGKLALTGLPTSCQDLWLIGHTLNGFYSIKGAKVMESVYCDFTKLPGDEGFEKWIGYDDVKSAPNLFFVQRNTWFNSMHTPIPFEIEQINAGNVMDSASGKFTAPRTGIYFFSFTGHADFPALSSPSTLAVSLLLDGGQIARGFVEDANTVKNQSSQLIVQSTLNLKSGNQVWMEIVALSSGVSLAHDTHFTGFMLEEEIVTSV